MQPLCIVQEYVFMAQCRTPVALTVISDDIARIHSLKRAFRLGKTGRLKYFKLDLNCITFFVDYVDGMLLPM